MFRAYAAVLFVSAYVGVSALINHPYLPNNAADAYPEGRTLVAAAAETSFLDFIGQAGSDTVRWAHCALTACEAEVPELAELPVPSKPQSNAPEPARPSLGHDPPPRQRRSLH